MGGRIHKYDAYDLRKFKPHDILTFIDIGAQIGSTSIMARLMFPYARIIAIEPLVANFEYLKKIKQWNIECYNVALGDGGNMAPNWHTAHGSRKFFSEDEKDKWPDMNDWPTRQYIIESKTFRQIITDYKIDLYKPYILKIDCEGGERFILNDSYAKEIIRNSEQTNFELHFGFGGSIPEWQAFISSLESTHVLRLSKWFVGKEEKMLVYVPIRELENDWKKCQIELIHKRHVGLPY